MSSRSISRVDLPLRVAVRSSRVHGLGVFATGELPARRKLGELKGSLVRLPDARRAVEGCERIYLVELTRRVALDCTEGNEFKYLNHSCRPNCYLRVIGRTVEVYTKEKIAPGTELTVDYGLTPHKGGMTCACRSTGCRERL